MNPEKRRIIKITGQLPNKPTKKQTSNIVQTNLKFLSLLNFFAKIVSEKIVILYVNF